MTSNDQRDEILREPASFPTAPARIVVSGPAGDIDGLVDLPAPDEAVPATAIICPPIADGATMHNKVNHIVERALRELGARTVRFNFRGVGDSHGHYDQGVGETEDLLAVAAWVARVRPSDELWLGGYGFGAWVALRASERLPVKQLVTVAPPVDRFDFSGIPLPQCPWLVVQGDADEMTSPEAVYGWVESIENPPQLLRMDDANHAFHRRLMDLRGAIKNGVRRQRKSDSDDTG